MILRTRLLYWQTCTTHPLDVLLLLHREQVGRQEGRNQADEQAGRGNLHGENDGAPPLLDEVIAGGGDHESGAGGLGVGPEQVGTHASHVAHVVAHVVSDGGRVAGVILCVRDSRVCSGLAKQEVIVALQQGVPLQCCIIIYAVSYVEQVCVEDGVPCPRSTAVSSTRNIFRTRSVSVIRVALPHFLPLLHMSYYGRVR